MCTIKVYEYLSRGCIILSVNRNRGLMELSLKYPGTILFIENFDPETFSRELESIEFNHLSAENCLKDAYSSNKKFVMDLLSINGS